MWFQIILPIPFVLFGVRLMLHRFVLSNDEHYYMRLTREFTLAFTGGTLLLVITYSRLFSSTPYPQLDHDLILTYLFVQLFSFLMEFRTTLKDVLFPAGVLVYCMFLSSYEPFWTMILYWLAVFSVLRSGETLANSLSLSSTRNTAEIAQKLHTNLSYAEFVVVFIKILEQLLVQEKAGVLDVTFALGVLAITHGDELKQHALGAPFSRRVWLPQPELVTDLVPSGRRAWEDEQVQRMRSRLLEETQRLRLGEGPSSEESDQVDESEPNVEITNL